MSILKFKSSVNTLPKGYWKNPIYLAACGFGSGASPYAPGTVGTVLAVILYIPLSQASLSNYLLFVGLAFIIGIYLCDRTAKGFAQHDHAGIVWDEFVGYWITMIAVPAEWLWIILGFIFFRFFDVVKPWPIRQIDRYVQGGFGIMLDDVIAGIYSWLLIWVLLNYV